MYAHQSLSSDHSYLKELNSVFIPLFFTTPVAIINPDYMSRDSFAVASLLFTESICTTGTAPDQAFGVAFCRHTDAGLGKR